MAAKDHLNNDQLRMFLRPSEIMGLVTDSVDRRQAVVQEHYFRTGQPMEALWEDKTEELVTAPEHQKLLTSVAMYGVKRPVTIIPPTSPSYPTQHSDYTMGQGHHRVAAAKELDDNMYIPVVYDWDFNHTNDPDYAPDDEEDLGGIY